MLSNYRFRFSKPKTFSNSIFSSYLVWIWIHLTSHYVSDHVIQLLQWWRNHHVMVRGWDHRSGRRIFYFLDQLFLLVEFPVVFPLHLPDQLGNDRKLRLVARKSRWRQWDWRWCQHQWQVMVLWNIKMIKIQINDKRTVYLKENDFIR